MRNFIKTILIVVFISIVITATAQEVTYKIKSVSVIDGKGDIAVFKTVATGWLTIGKETVRIYWQVPGKNAVDMLFNILTTEKVVGDLIGHYITNDELVRRGIGNQLIYTPRYMAKVRYFFLYSMLGLPTPSDDSPMLVLAFELV